MIPKTIVVPLDGSRLAERAVQVAAPLSARLGTNVVLARATYGDVRAAGSYLDYVAAVSGELEFDTVVVSDVNAADAIGATVRDRPDSMVCMTTHGGGRMRWATAGSVAEQVIRDSTQPLLLIGPRGEPAWTQPAQRIVVCVDGSSAGELAVRHACEWAQALELEIALVIATHPLDVEATEHPETVFGPLEKIVRDEGIAFHCEQIFRSSFIAGALVDFAEAPAATLIVMAAHHHRALARLALGSTTMGVLNCAPCPVLVIPPDSD